MVAQDRESRARLLHARGVQATNSGRPAVGAARLRRGLALLGWGAADPGVVVGPELAARLLISLSWAEAELGRTRHGFELLEQAREFVAPADRGILHQQRGLMLIRTGRVEEALVCLDEAIVLLEDSEHVAVLARTLLNRAGLQLGLGRVRAVRDDLDRCTTIARRAGLPLVIAKADHNRGLCEILVGDIPAALSALRQAEVTYLEHAPNFVPVVLAARARALLSAGLAGEAARILVATVAALGAQRLSQDEAEAKLLIARAELSSGHYDAAQHWARQAERAFQGRGNSAWAALASGVALRARAAGGRATRGFIGRAEQIAERLGKLGLTDDAELARLLAARAMIASGATQRAQSLLREQPHARWYGWLETLVMRRLTRAELAVATGQPGEALRHARLGLAALHGQRGRLGSLDLRVGTAELGRELAALGLRTALASGDPRTVLSWSERSRAQAFRVLPVKAPQDPQIAEALAQLRQLRHQMRASELAGQRDTTGAARCAELERTLREREWQTAGVERSAPGVTLGRIRSALGDRALVSFVGAGAGTGLVALVVDPDQARLVPLPGGDLVAEAIRRLLADIDALAGRSLPERIEAVIRTSVRRQVQSLGEVLLAPLSALIGDRALVVVPNSQLSALPWAMLPALRGRPVTVAPSVRVWLAAQERTSTVEGLPLLAAGPDLVHADREFDEIGALYPGCVDLRGEQAGVAKTLLQLARAPVAHLAGHGHHEPENVLFSRLDLADGPLMAYDIQRLDSVPALITLSACDVGRAAVRVGDEHLGFTAALLYAGTNCVVSSVCRVSHETAVSVMTGLHRRLSAGVGPARALAEAAVDEPLATFVAFGAG